MTKFKFRFSEGNIGVIPNIGVLKGAMIGECWKDCGGWCNEATTKIHDTIGEAAEELLTIRRREFMDSVTAGWPIRWPV